VACGGSSSADAISKGEFLKKANAICENGNTDIEQAAKHQFPEKGGKPSQTQVLRYVSSTVTPDIQHQIDELKKLGAPEGDEEPIKIILAETQRALVQAKKTPAALIKGGPGPFAGADKFAKAYGLIACEFGLG
jgi:hypothetical protein